MSSDDPRNATRRQVIQAAGAGVALAVGIRRSAPARAAQGVVDGRSPLVQAGDVLGGLEWSLPDADVVERYGMPSWIVRYDEGHAESLLEWAGRRDDRHLVLDSATDDVALVAAEPGDIGVSWLDRLRNQGLLSDGWIESVDLDVHVEVVEPVNPRPADDFRFGEQISRWQDLQVNKAALEDGLAHRDDMPEASIGDVRAQTNANVGVAHGDRTVVIFDTGVTAGAVFEDADANTRIQGTSADYTSTSEQPTVSEQSLEVVADENGHGNWVAAAIVGDGATHSGYAPDASIVALKVLDDDGSGSAFLIAEAIRYAADETAADVGCASLGSPAYSAELDRAYAYAAGAGLPIATAAGNDRQASTWVSSPADSPDAITVTAVTAEPATEARSASFSNIDPDSGMRNLSGGQTAGSHVDVAAPGCEIEVETPDGLSRLTGTSMAAPCVAGGLLLLMAADADIRGDVDVAKARISEHAQAVPAAGETEVGHGMLDVQAAIDEAEPAETQAEAMDDTAASRDDAHEALSATEGGILWRYL